MEAQRKKKSGRLKRRMRGALAKLGGPMGRRPARDHVTDDTQVLVGNEQDHETELDIASTSKPETVYPATDQPTKKKKKNPIFAKLVNVTAKFGRHKSTSDAEGKGKRGRKKYKTITTEIINPMPPCSELFESELDRLITTEPEVETSMNDDVTSTGTPNTSATILHVPQPEENHTVEHEEVRRSDDETIECEVIADGQPGVNDVTRQQGDTKKHRKRKRAKRYAKRAGVTAWKGIRSSWKYISTGLAVLSVSTGFGFNTTGGVIHAWQQWQSTASRSHA